VGHTYFGTFEFANSIRPFFGTKICLNAVCNSRSRNQLYGQSHKLVTFIKVSFV